MRFGFGFGFGFGSGSGSVRVRVSARTWKVPQLELAPRFELRRRVSFVVSGCLSDIGPSVPVPPLSPNRALHLRPKADKFARRLYSS